MNPGFIIVVSFGLVFVVAIIFIAILGAKFGGYSQPTALMGNVRQFQNQMENAGWRIKMIPWDDTSRPMRIDSSGLLGTIPILGALGFFVGLAIAAYDNPKHLWPGLIVAVSSWLVALGGWLLKNRMVHMNWDVAAGKCMDRELQKICVPVAESSGWVWCWRFVCEYEYLGIFYRVTPEIHWMGFPSEEAARKFCDRRIAPDGKCQLRVDPKNPLRTQLLELGNG